MITDDLSHVKIAKQIEEQDLYRNIPVWITNYARKRVWDAWTGSLNFRMESAKDAREKRDCDMTIDRKITCSWLGKKRK